MAIGDAALAAGMTLVPGTALANTLDTAINETRDFIAQRTSAVTPVAKGGTGATTASAARAALDVPQKGTSGGIAVMDITGAGNVGLRYGGSRFVARSGSTELELANLLDVNGATGAADAANANANGRVSKSGDTMSGHLYLPNSSAAVSGYTIAYINSDGRVSRGASSLRYKKYVSAVDPLTLGDIWPQLKRFQMKQLDGTADGSWLLGHIAEELAEHHNQARFAVAINGLVESIDFIQLLLAQTAQLNARVRQLEAVVGIVNETTSPAAVIPTNEGDGA
jgi:hypothetical protein